MSIFFNAFIQSFLSWFNTVYYWSYKPVKKNKNKFNYTSIFFFKKIIILESFELLIASILSFLFKFKFFKNLRFLITSMLIGLKSVWLHIRFWLLPLILVLLIFLNFMYVKALPFNKVIFLWVALFMIFYWLVSGFVFFIKKYQYGKYTSSIQRFWKRSYILFWLLETCLLLVFVYLTFTASQESFYMFDQIQVYKTHLFSWRLFLSKNLPVIILISLGYFLVLTLKWNTFSKHSVWLLIITFLLTYVIWIEFYQFYHILNFYGNLNWVYDFDDKIWNLELEARRTRIVNNYVMLLLILRFWHLIFVYVFWLFFVLRGCEIKRLRYPLLAANFQNLIILYIMNWITMYPWLKLMIRKYLNQPYTAFNVNNRSLFFRVFFNDIKLYLLNLIESDVLFFKNYFNKSFFYFIEWSQTLHNQHIRKHYIKNNIIYDLKSNETNSNKLNFLINLWWIKAFESVEDSMVLLHFNKVFDLLTLFEKLTIYIHSLLRAFLGFIVYFYNSLVSFIF